MQPIIVKYEHVSIIDDEDMKIMCSTVSSYPCLLCAELFIDAQPIKDSQLIYERYNYEALVRSIATIHVNEQVILCYSPDIVDTVPAIICSKYIKEQFCIMDSDIQESIIRQVSSYTTGDDMIHLDSHFFHEDNVVNEDMKDEALETRPSYDIESSRHNCSKFAIFKAPSRTFT